MKNKCILGIDTSNYRTSVALVDIHNNILLSKRELLQVKKGERGLQQSFALFQHIKKLPEMLEAMELSSYDIVAVACSTRPRNVKGSYMPVFLAGQSIARSIATAKGIPLYEFSHQEGHIAAATYQSQPDSTKEMAAFHFSGGTTECLHIQGHKLQIIGGTLDLAFGQVIDRLGVKLGLPFPAGAYIDQMALEAMDKPISITPVKVKDSYFNLSGLETQLLKLVNQVHDEKLIAKTALEQITKTINHTMDQIHSRYGIDTFIFAGGVSSSQYLQQNISKKYNCTFAPEELSGDNAIGIAILGGKAYGKEASHHNTTK